MRMNVLVVYYSRSGNTKKIAEKIVKKLKADIDEIKDLKNRKGIIGFLSGGKDVVTKKLTKIEFEKNPYKYDLVIIGTPVWASTMTPAIKTYLEKNKDIAKAAVFCTYGASEGRTFTDIREKIGKVVAEMGLLTREINECDGKLNKFLKKINTSFS